MRTRSVPDPTAGSAPALAVAELHVRYGSVPAVRGVSWSVPSGGVLALLGNNGAGKTSTLSAVAGLVAPRSGRVTLGGRDVTGWRSDRLVRTGLALVPEGRRVFPSVSVRDHLVLGATAHRRRGPLRRSRREAAAGFAADVDAALARFPVLGRRLDARAGELSGGEQQQLALARALMSHPRVLVLDEPSLGLAPQVIDLVLNTLADLRTEGMTIVLVEQHAEQALQLADTVVVLARGAVTHTGPAAELRGSGTLDELYLGPSRPAGGPR